MSNFVSRPYVIQLDPEGTMDGPELWGPFESESAALVWIDEMAGTPEYRCHFKMVYPSCPDF